MRDPGRIDPIIELLREAWKASPDERLCQLIENIAATERSRADKSCIFNVEDTAFEARLRARMPLSVPDALQHAITVLRTPERDWTQGPNESAWRTLERHLEQVTAVGARYHGDFCCLHGGLTG